MPDPDTGLDQAGGAVQPNDAMGSTGNAGSSEGDQAKIVFGSFKNPEDAAKAFEDLQAQNRRFQSEKDQALSQATKLQEQVLSKLADVATQQNQPQGPSPAEQEAKIREWCENYDKDGDAKMLYEFVSEAMSAARQGAVTEAEEKLGGKVSELEKMLQAINGQVASQNPEYLSVKEEYDAIAAKLPDGTPRETIMAVAKELKAAKGPSQPARPDLPGGTGSPVVTGQERTGVSSDVKSLVAGIASAAAGKKVPDAVVDKLNNESWSK